MAEPQRNVGRDKQRRMVAAAKSFLYSDERKNLPADLEVFFDVMSVVFYGAGADYDIEYYPQAFIPLYA
jgi:Holliday junction resolvase-like predicted endonuclease